MKEISGVIPVHKEAGMTSHDVVAILRKKLGIKKIGHSGTLDPMVTGVLPVLIGKATRLSDYFMNVPKKYHVIGCLGQATDTEDAHGEVVAEGDASGIPSSLVERTLNGFIGEIDQVPPDYSAVKIKGKKLIDYAHRGEKMPEKQTRRVHIYRIRFHRYQDYEFEFDITCSKGTYVRTICSDLGKKLGIPAHMKELTRMESGGFHLSEALPLEQCTLEAVIPMDAAVRKINNVSRFVLPYHPNTRKRLENGIRFDVRRFASGFETFDAAGNVQIISNLSQIRNLPQREDAHYFLYLEDRFYGIVNSNFELERLIKDN